MNQPSFSPILYDYLRRYQENPRSRVFAPLAEAYRKAGLVDEAVEIAREGLKVHPNFVGGRVALARALFEKRQYEQVVDELQPVIRDVPDNLVAQRLIAESSLILGRVSQALDSYKMLLYFSPEDTELARVVQELESQSYQQGALVLQAEPAAAPAVVAADFRVEETGRALGSDPAFERSRWIRRIELLQNLLLRVEKYRQSTSNHAG